MLQACIQGRGHNPGFNFSPINIGIHGGDSNCGNDLHKAPPLFQNPGPATVVFGKNSLSITSSHESICQLSMIKFIMYNNLKRPEDL